MTTAFDDHERRQWAGRAQAYARSFAKLCAYPAPALLEAAGVAAGVRLLDVGTGPGTVAQLACARGAVVSAVDAEPSMVELAQRNVPAANVCLGVLPHLPYPDDSFDAAVANFVINHVGDPGAAVSELRRVVHPGGSIAITVWPHPAPPLQNLWQEIMQAAGVTRRTTMPTVTADRNFDRTQAGLTGLLRDAKLTQVSCQTITWQHHTDPQAWWTGPANGIGALGLAITGQPAQVVAKVKQHYETLTARYLTAEGLLTLPTAALLASGTS